MNIEWNGYYRRTKAWPDDYLEEIMTESTNSSEEQQYLKVEVRNPRTHISREKALYTDYEIVIETNNIAFASMESCVRRRYSDFQWLRKRLVSIYSFEAVGLPELPPKRLFGRFKRQFLKHRQNGLQKFLEETISHTAFLSDVALHLFLQSSLSVKDIEAHLEGNASDNELIDALHSPSRSKNGRFSGFSRSVSLVDEGIEVGNDRDSGCYYSTASSINEIGHHPSMKFVPPNPVNYFTSMPADLDKVLDHSTAGHSFKSVQRESPSKLRAVSQHSLSLELTTAFPGPYVPPVGTSSRRASFSTTEDEYTSCCNYDADDEVDSGHVDIETESQESDDLFRLTSSSSYYSLHKATEILQARPRLSDRMFQSDEDSDECFRESEYDVIDSQDDELEGIVSDESYPKANCSTRARSYSEDRTGQVVRSPQTRKLEKQKMGKVRSLPNIRFPLPQKPRSVRRSITFHGVVDVTRRELNDLEEKDENLLVLADARDKRSDQLVTSSQNCYRSESDGHNQNSETDYLQTLHRGTEQSDCHQDTNLDTQAEDAAPQEYWDFFRRRKRRAHVPSSLHLNALVNASNSMSSQNRTKGRFLITPVAEVCTPVLESRTLHIESTLSSKSLPQTTVSSDKQDSDNSDVRNNNVPSNREDLKSPPPVIITYVDDTDVSEEKQQLDPWSVTDVTRHNDFSAVLNTTVSSGTDASPFADNFGEVTVVYISDCKSPVLSSSSVNSETPLAPVVLQNSNAELHESNSSDEPKLCHLYPDICKHATDIFSASSIHDSLSTSTCSTSETSLKLSTDLRLSSSFARQESCVDVPELHVGVILEQYSYPLEAIQLQTLNDASLQFHHVTRKCKVKQTLASLLNTYDIIPSTTNVTLEPVA